MDDIVKLVGDALNKVKDLLTSNVDTLDKTQADFVIAGVSEAMNSNSRNMIQEAIKTLKSVAMLVKSEQSNTDETRDKAYKALEILTQSDLLIDSGLKAEINKLKLENMLD